MSSGGFIHRWSYNMAWNKHTAAVHARQNAGSSSQKRCGEFTRKAILAGGVDIEMRLMPKTTVIILNAQGFVF
jgi:hypothetical protein